MRRDYFLECFESLVNDEIPFDEEKAEHLLCEYGIKDEDVRRAVVAIITVMKSKGMDPCA